jgi:hypothetical protein
VLGLAAATERVVDHSAQQLQSICAPRRDRNLVAGVRARERALGFARRAHVRPRGLAIYRGRKLDQHEAAIANRQAVTENEQSRSTEPAPVDEHAVATAEVGNEQALLGVGQLRMAPRNERSRKQDVRARATTENNRALGQLVLERSLAQRKVHRRAHTQPATGMLLLFECALLNHLAKRVPKRNTRVYSILHALGHALLR